MNTFDIHLVTLGCAKNEVDSAHMTKQLLRAGYRMVDDPADADAIIVNTCTFIQSATEESIDTIFDMLAVASEASADQLREKVQAPIIVVGCMVSRYGKELEKSLPEVTSFVPLSREDDIVEELGKLIGKPVEVPPYAYLPSTTPWTAYVKISDGCDRFCSYCTIPYIRGRYHSFPYQDIRAEVAEYVEQGIREVTLIAQDTGRWGKDFEEPSSLAELLSSLAEEFTDTWFRVMYLEPEGITYGLLSVIAEHDNICSYLDIPLQHCEKRVLRAMNRRGSYDQFIELIETIRKQVPDIALRTTLIAGFPGETDEDHEAMLDFISDARLEYVGVFAYSTEEGTRAARLPEQLDEETKIARANAVREHADTVSNAVIAERIGKPLDVLVLGREEDGQLYGRAQCQAPDVDGVTFLDDGEPGTIVAGTIGNTLMYEMEFE